MKDTSESHPSDPYLAGYSQTRAYVLQLQREYAERMPNTTMRLTTHTNRWIARLMLGLVLFAQGVVSTYACDVKRGNATQAFATQAAEHGEMPCHDEVVSNANACLDHCTQSDRISVDQVTHLFAVSGIAVLVVALSEQTAAKPARQAASRVATDSGPPPNIRFCSFQI